MRGSSSRACVALSVSGWALIASGVLAASANAAEAPAVVASAPPASETEVEQVVITAAKGRAASVAPVASSLNAVEPQAVITRRFIEESAPRVGDYTTSAILAPSLSTASNPNGPGATDGAKLTLRGFQDGEYNTTYDGIAWGDTNGPSHHANSFFPSSTIGGIVVDRGPGYARDLGQANFGGSVNLFSLPFEDQLGGRQTVTGGSFGTWQAVTTFATGPMAKLHDANLVLNFMEYATDGYLSHSPSSGQNQFFKLTVPITSHLRITALYTHNYDQYNQGDASGTATVAQTSVYGKRFALSNDPTLATFYRYNATKKKTDFGYLRGDLDLGAGWSITDTAYTYYYNNRTLSANNNGADATLGLSPTVALGSPAQAALLVAANKVTLTPAAVYPVAGSGYSSKLQTTGLPGYLKRNEYRVTGDNFEAVKIFGFGKLSVGGEYEAANTQRSRFDIDILTQLPDYREKAAVYAGPTSCAVVGLPTISAPGKTNNGACQEPLNVAYNEYSGWRQYQLYGQFEWRPLQGLNITPGVKYVNFKLFVHAPTLAISKSLQPSFTENTYTKTLPFFTVNYRPLPDLAVYAQYAQGFLVPNITAFYVVTPLAKPVVPQQSTNYQVGTVYSRGKLTFDADLYYIEFKNKIQTLIDLGTNESYETNLGGATYKGVEAQGTYVLPFGLSVFANGSLNDAVGNGDPNNPGYDGHQLAKVPFWTGAAGLRFGRNGLFSSDDAFVATLNTKWVGQQYANAASGPAVPTARLPSWSETNLSGTYRFRQFAIEGQVLNLLDSSSVTAFKGSALISGTNLPATTIAQGGGANVFTYQAGRSFQLTLKADF